MSGERRTGDRRAEALRRLYHARFGDQPLPVPVDAIAEDLLGLRVVESDTLEESGMLIPARCEILLNAGEARDSEGRRRFTLAHEIGHWICHCRRAQAMTIFCRRPDVTSARAGDVREREANVFAAELLMPEPEVRRAYGDGTSPGELAGQLEVSEVALQWRLFNLDLLDQAPAGSAAG